MSSFERIMTHYKEKLYNLNSNFEISHIPLPFARIAEEYFWATKKTAYLHRRAEITNLH